MPVKKENIYQHAETIIDIMIEISGFPSQTRFAEAVLGIKGGNVSSARKTRKIPDTWFKIFLDKYGFSREELCDMAKDEIERTAEDNPSSRSPKAVAELVQSWSDDTPDEDREKFIQDMNGLFSIIMRWQEEEHGADSLTSMQFIQLFHERIPELGEWIKKQKGSASLHNLPGNLSVAGGES